MLIKFRVTSNIEELDSIITESKGKIYLELPNKVLLDLKKEHDLYDLLKKEKKENNVIMLHVYDKDDYFRFVNYMI